VSRNFVQNSWLIAELVLVVGRWMDGGKIYFKGLLSAVKILFYTKLVNLTLILKLRLFTCQKPFEAMC
jgi:hypothetical protein